MTTSQAAGAPVTNPTWYAQIRDMFTSTDRAHMLPQGLDLASYTDVAAHAGNIYQQVASGNMPRPTPWPSDWAATFLNWMTNGCPMGAPPVQTTAKLFAARSMGAGAPVAARVRKDINSLSAGEVTLLKKAFTEIMARPVDDPNGYFSQAGTHWFPGPNLYCMHHAPGYNPWHRAYMLNFENALRSVPGCEQVTLPYWDITTPFPEVLKSAPFDKYVFPQDVGPGYPKGYTTSRFDYATIAANLLEADVTNDVNRALAATNWETFHGYWSGATRNTIISAHDGGHDSIGTTMQAQEVAAFDPIFWFFHCNWDRLWWAWQKKMEATDLHGLVTTINQQTDALSYQMFNVPILGALPPFTQGTLKLDAPGTIDSAALDVDYDVLPAAAVLPQTRLATAASRAFSVVGRTVNVRVDGIKRLMIPGTFAVHLQKDGRTIATKAMFQPVEVAKCPNCAANEIAQFDFELPLSAVQGGKLSVWVEPRNQNFVGDRFPQKLMGNPTIEVRLPLEIE